MKRVFGKIAVLWSIALMVACSAGQGKLENMGTADFAELIKDTTVVLLDVRTPEEFAAGHINGALNIDVKDSHFISAVQEQIARGNRVAVYCRSGRRSLNAAGQMVEKGYDVVNLEGGFLAWEEAQK